MEIAALPGGFEPAFYAGAAAFAACLAFWPLCLYKYKSLDLRPAREEGAPALRAIERLEQEAALAPLPVISQAAEAPPTVASVGAQSPPAVPAPAAAPTPKPTEVESSHPVDMKSRLDGLGKEVETLKRELLSVEERQAARMEKVLDRLRELMLEVRRLQPAKSGDAGTAAEAAAPVPRPEPVKSAAEPFAATLPIESARPVPAGDPSASRAPAPEKAPVKPVAPAPAVEEGKTVKIDIAPPGEKPPVAEPIGVIDPQAARKRGPVWPV